MKTIQITIYLFFSTIIFGQETTIYPLGTPTSQIVNGGYEKDTQNQLNTFQGTWVYTQGSKKVTIKLEKLIYQVSLPNKDYYKDKIKGRYKVENGSTVIYNDLSEPMLTGDINGANFWQGYYQMSYWDEKECRLLYHVKIKLDPNNPDKLIWEMYGDGLTPFDTDCPRADEEEWGTVSTLPVNMVLTKQSLSGGL